MGPSFLGDFSIWFVILFYAALLSLTFGWSGFKEWFGSLKRTHRLGGRGRRIPHPGIGLLLVWRAAVAVPDGLLHVTFLDVGSADAVLDQNTLGKVHADQRWFERKHTFR